MNPKAKIGISALCFLLVIYSFKNQKRDCLQVKYNYYSTITDSILNYQVEKSAKVNRANHRDSAMIILEKENFYLISYGRNVKEFYYLDSVRSVFEVNRKDGTLIRRKLDARSENQMTNEFVSSSNDSALYLNNIGCYKRMFTKGSYKYEIYLALNYKSTLEANSIIISDIVGHEELLKFLGNSLIIKMKISNEYGETVISAKQLFTDLEKAQYPPIPEYKSTRELKNINKYLPKNEKAFEIIE